MPGPAGIKDVAMRAGVSIGTVSNVLNRPHLVRSQTRERVEAAMADLAFVRNESARQLRAGSSRMIAYIFVDAESPSFVEVARGVEDACRASGFSLILCHSGADPAREDDYLNLLLEHRVRGVLFTSTHTRNTRLRTLPDLGVPVVLLDQCYLDGGAWCSVGTDDHLGALTAMLHLVEQGHRRIGYVGNRLSIPQGHARLEGARGAVDQAGLPPEALTVVELDAATARAGQQAGRRLAALPAARRPTAVLCVNDLVALGLMQELLRQQVRVPDDIAIVGYDDIPFAATAAVPLTSVRPSNRQIGRVAAEILLAEPEPGSEAARTHVHRHVAFPPELVIRESSGPCRTT